LKKDKSHFIYWCWLNQGEPGPLNHVRDFLRIISDSKFFDKIVVFSNINLNKNLKEIYVCNISTKSYLVFQIISFFRMVKSFSKTEHQVFYFRYCSFLFLPIFLKLMGKREIFLEINGIPNQFLLEGLRRPFTKYFRKLLLQQYDRFLFQRVDHIVTVCSVFRDNLVKNYGVRKVILAPNGIFIDKVKLMSRNVAKRLLGLDKKKRYCIYVGALVYYEGLEFLIEAFQDFCRSYSTNDVVLLILGDGNLRRKLQFQIAPAYKKNIIFLGYIGREKTRQYIAASHIGVYTPQSVSYGYDGQRGGSPLKIIDYLAAGRPILVPKSKYYAYVESEQIGFLYEPENSKSFGDALNKLIYDDAKCDKLGENARRYAESHLDWKITLSHLLAILGKEKK